MRGMWRTFKDRAFELRPVEYYLRNAKTSKLKKAMGTFDLVMLGVGAIVGAGAFVLTGEVAKETTGPSVVVSYVLAGLAAIFAAVNYTEFAVDIPAAGTSFNYMMVVFGDLAAWIAAVNLVLEYAISTSVTAKGLSSYTATLLGFEGSTFIVTVEGAPYIELDVIGFMVVLLLCTILCIGITESKWTNNIATGFNMFTIMLIILLATPYSDIDNLAPFAPFGMSGIFRGSAIVFFSFIGFDTVATVVEEVKNPGKMLPIGIIGSLVISMLLYLGMTLAIVLMVRYKDIHVDAPFAQVFVDKGLQWAAKLVSAGALAGIFTCVFSGLLGQARIFMALGREGFLPRSLGTVHPRTKTPINATLVTAVITGVSTLCLNLEILANLTSIGTLFLLAMVCVGIIWRTYYIPGSGADCKILTCFVTLVVLGSVFEGVFSQQEMWVHAIIALGAWLIGTVGLAFLPVLYKSPVFNVPFKPLVPSLGVLFTLHLMCSMDWMAYVRFGVWQVLGVLIYLFYSMYSPREYYEEGPLLEGDGYEPID